MIWVVFLRSGWGHFVPGPTHRRHATDGERGGGGVGTARPRRRVRVRTGSLRHAPRRRGRDCRPAAQKDQDGAQVRVCAHAHGRALARARPPARRAPPEPPRPARLRACAPYPRPPPDCPPRARIRRLRDWQHEQGIVGCGHSGRSTPSHCSTPSTQTTPASTPNSSPMRCGPCRLRAKTLSASAVLATPGCSRCSGASGWPAEMQYGPQ